jgi:hypothetical protein
MPLDSTFLRFRDRITWQQIYAWWPRRCATSMKLIWLKSIWQGTITWTGSGYPIVEHSYLSKEEFLMSRLRGEI